MQKFLFLILFLVSYFSYSQATEYKLSWDAKKPLSWQNFQAAPNHGTRYDATTNSGISYSWSLTTGNGKDDFRYEVKSNFYPDLSWVKPNKTSDYLLAHEQLHFDISELHARKLRKAIQEYRMTKDVKQDLRKIYHAIESERQEMQKKYDLESKHSLQKDSEEKWQKYVKSELEKYNQYAL